MDKIIKEQFRRCVNIFLKINEPSLYPVIIGDYWFVYYMYGFEE